VRRYVVETPVEEQVTLHDQRVVLDRRPVTGTVMPDAGSFTDRVIEMAETREEAVVSKTAQVVEEVRLRRESVERVETVRDTVRREDVEVEQLPKERLTPPR
jgi:stress response protein YsnF